MAAEPLLEVEDLYAGYGRYDVLKGVSFHVNPAEMVCIIGPNGAGKSTVLRVVSGTLTPRQGRILLAGADIAGLPPETLCRRGIAHVLQGRSVFPEMTVFENLEMGAYLRRDAEAVRRDVEAVYAEFPVLREKSKALAGSLSGGEQQMLEMARALLSHPKLILLDEPSLGLSPKFSDLVFEKIAALSARGHTLVIVEQNAQRALEVAHRGVVLELGCKRFEGPGRELLHNEDVKRLYLGG